MKRHAEQMPHHKRQKHGARRLCVFGYVERDAQRDGRNSSFFHCALHERDALVANRSGGSEQRNVRLFRFDCLGDVFGKSSLQAFRVHIVADKRIKILGQAADNFFSR